MSVKAGAPASWQPKLAAHLFTLAVLGLWYGVSWLVPPYQLPGPEDVAVRACQFFNLDYFVGGVVKLVFGDRLATCATGFDDLLQMLYSFGHILAAVAISFVIGSVLALAAHFLPVSSTLVHGRISPFLNSFSGVAWIFLAVIWFSVGPFSVVFVISMVLIPFAVINMREGLISLDQEMIEMSRSFTRSRWRQFGKIILPSLYPFIFATIRISFGVAWKVGLTAEFFAGGQGMGYLLSLAQNDFDNPLIFTVILIIVAFVYSFDRLVFEPIQKRLARHHAG